MSCLTSHAPEGFNASLEVAACYVLWEGRILLLRRHLHKSEGGRYGPPAGKVIQKESLELAIIRELREETGIQVSDLQFTRTYFVRYPKYDFKYHVFKQRLNNKPDIILSKTEHTSFEWVSPVEALKLPLVTGEDESIRLTFGIK